MWTVITTSRLPGFKLNYRMLLLSSSFNTWTRADRLWFCYHGTVGNYYEFDEFYEPDRNIRHSINEDLHLTRWIRDFYPPDFKLQRLKLRMTDNSIGYSVFVLFYLGFTEDHHWWKKIMPESLNQQFLPFMFWDLVVQAALTIFVLKK